MKKIVKIGITDVYIANETGGFIVVQLQDLDFTPKLGDIVEVYQNGNDFLVLKPLQNEVLSDDILQFANKSDKSRKIAGFLALFGGIVGLHDFYLRQYSKAFYHILPVAFAAILSNEKSPGGLYYYESIVFLYIVLVLCFIWGFIESLLIFCSNEQSYWSKDSYGEDLR